jgi:hypothetical protein
MDSKFSDTLNDVVGIEESKAEDDNDEDVQLENGTELIERRILIDFT